MRHYATCAGPRSWKKPLQTSPNSIPCKRTTRERPKRSEECQVLQEEQKEKRVEDCTLVTIPFLHVGWVLSIMQCVIITWHKRAVRAEYRAKRFNLVLRWWWYMSAAWDGQLKGCRCGCRFFSEEKWQHLAFKLACRVQAARLEHMQLLNSIISYASF